MNCHECGALQEGCKARFYELLAMEFSDPGYGTVHHLTVAAYMLQHSGRLGREGWRFERNLLREFVVAGKSPVTVMAQCRDVVDSNNRQFTFTSNTGKTFVPENAWTMTIMDIRSGNADEYCKSVISWARSTLAAAETIEV